MYHDTTNTETESPRPQWPVARRSLRTAIQEPGASKLTEGELAVVTQALTILEHKVIRKLKAGEILTSPQRVKEWLALHYGMLEHEVFGLIFLDSKNRVLGHQQLFSGDVHSAQIYPRQVVRAVFHWNAAAVLAVHCHPSLQSAPSHADELITRHLREILAGLEVRLLDHLIVAGTQVASMAELGRM